MTEAVLTEPGSAPQLDVDSCDTGSETRSTVRMRDCLICTVVHGWYAQDIPYILAYKSQNLRQNLELKVG